MAKRSGAVHVATTKRTYKGKVYETHLLRRTYREGGKVKHETLGNLSHLPPDLIATIRQRLGGQQPSSADGWEIVRAYPHGHVAGVLHTLGELDLQNLLASRPSRMRSLVVALIVARVIKPASKLATAKQLREETAKSSLAIELQLDDVEAEELYEALDWLRERQNRIENKLAKKHLQDGTLLLYDVSGSYYTGRRSRLVQFGHPRDGKPRFPQIIYGLLCDRRGCPISIEVFPGNTGDPNTLSSQVKKIRKRFGVRRVVVVGDRGMITSKRIDEELRGVDGLDWITALRADSIKKLASAKVIQPSLFDERNLAEISSPDYPGERLVVCRNLLLADERTRKRNELLKATEKKLDEVVAATQRNKRPLRGKAKIGVRIGKLLNRYKVGKHFVLQISDDKFSYQRDESKIAEEAALDGLYVIRTSVGTNGLSSEDTVRAYKDLSKIERAFRCMKTIDLKVRPIHHWLDKRIEAHVFLCMLAYYLEWHMRRKLRPILFDDHEREAAETTRKSIVSPAPRSAAARRKDATNRTDDDHPVESFRELLDDLGTLTKNRVRIRGTDVEFYQLAQATPLQKHAFDLLGATPA